MTTRKTTHQTKEQDQAEPDWDEFRRCLVEANWTLGSRIEAEGLQLDYSAENDVLSIYLHVPIKGVGDYLNDDDFQVTFYDEDSMLVEGFEVLFFLERLAEAPSGVDVWKRIAAYLESGKSGTFSPPAKDLKVLGEGLQSLLLAAA